MQGFHPLDHEFKDGIYTLHTDHYKHSIMVGDVQHTTVYMASEVLLH